MKNIKFYARCVLKDGIPRKERKKGKKEKKIKNERKKNIELYFY